MTAGLAQREIFGRTLVALANDDPRVLVLDGDLANSTRADIFAEAHPDRFLAMGIAEQNMAGVAAGLATLGFVPWISTFAAFAVKRDLDQVRVVIAQPALNVKIAGGYSGLLTGFTGKTHQSVADIAVMRALPNMVVLAPADGVEAREAMRAANAHHGPVYLRLARDPSPAIFDEDYQFVIGRGVVLREGGDIAIVSTGVHTSRAREACDVLAADGIGAYHLHLPTLKPIDAYAIVAAAERTGLVLVTEEHSVIGGLGGAVAEVLGQRLPTLMRLHGIDDVFGESGPNEAILEKYRLTPRHIAEAARELLGRRN
ncbi:MAG: transketolase family protein [Chloroflexota bacterium]|nr:transketolase family protein [Chloroflexota bacterium]